MSVKRFLVIGATGHVGSKVAVLLANRGHDVTAMVRRTGATILDTHTGTIGYVVGDLNDETSIANAVRGVDVVVCTANGVVPQAGGGDAGSVNDRGAAVNRALRESWGKPFCSVVGTAFSAREPGA